MITTAAPSSKRVISIDILRGLVMVVMALDHARDYFSGFKFDPTDIDHTTPALFFTRWITHFCAPTFIFLAGTSSFLSMRKGKTKPEQAWHLFSRGVWMILLEVTVVYFGWMFSFHYDPLYLQVIWATGWCMICLAGLIFLPPLAILTFALAMIFGHDAFDSVQTGGGDLGILWDVLHVQGPITFHGHHIFIIYPLVPWIGVMAAGYCFGQVVTLPEPQRNKWMYIIGLSATAMFIILRAINGYGDPSPWIHRSAAWRTFLDFLSDRKYPPSLLYLLMTLGPAIAALPLLDKLRNRVGDTFTVYGRVPLFYYILHIYLLHLMAVLAGKFFMAEATVTIFNHPGFSLPVVYGVWLTAVVILYFPCRWFMRIKMSHRNWWLSYL